MTNVNCLLDCRQQTAEAIKVMQALPTVLQCRRRGWNAWADVSESSSWNWSEFDYRRVERYTSPDIARMIQVMQAFLDGKVIEIKSAGWEQCLTPRWDWANDDYRVAPPPKPTFEDSVRAHLKAIIENRSGTPAVCSCGMRATKDLYRKLFNEEP